MERDRKAFLKDIALAWGVPVRTSSASGVTPIGFLPVFEEYAFGD